MTGRPRISARPLTLALGALLAACGTAPGLSLCLPPDGRFELHYVHSAERSPVVERYRVDAQGRLWLEGMRFRSLGWGLPADGFVRRAGWFETTTPPRRLDEFVLRVSRLAGQELRAAGRVLVLSAVARDGAALRVEAASTPTCPRLLVLRQGP